MYRVLSLLLAATLSVQGVQAQTPHIEKSEAFAEPEEGWNKVLQMKNGNTFFFHSTKKEGFEVYIFNKDRKVSSSKAVTSEVWEPKKMRQSKMVGLFDINNEAVLFMVQTDGKEPTLYRLRFDGTTGALIKDEELGSLSKPRMFTFSGDVNDIYVEKDPESDCYAVIYFNSFAKERDERIKVAHYNGSHKLINVAFYESPDDSYKYLKYIGAVVDGDKRLFLTIYGAASLKGRDARVYISRLSSSDSVFANKTLEFTEDFKDTKSVMAYNRSTNTLRLLTMSYATSGSAGFLSNATKTVYMSFLSYLDPEAMTIKKIIPIAGQKVDEYIGSSLQLKYRYHGLPQAMVMNPDNSTTILSEELTQQITTQNGAVISATTVLGAIGVNELTEEGLEKNGFAIIKSQVAVGLFNPLYITSRSKGRWERASNGSASGGQRNFATEYNSYLSYDYIATDKNRYIFFNDNPGNFEKGEDETKRKPVTSAEKLNTYCYSLNGNTVNKFYLFGEPGKYQSNSCHIEASDFQKSTGTYATIMVERNKGDRQARLVWVKFD